MNFSNIGNVQAAKVFQNDIERLKEENAILERLFHDLKLAKAKMMKNHISMALME
ncbi:hypothetical protein [Citrobacter sp. NCU1]|uniref:hypothetical protein n=1 Tax=Citrobacter sp. NCU1 TaxID=2026683 RepID=UPI001391F648|nr:hypothetical protein [Citrobacter sp. NCU1]